MRTESLSQCSHEELLQLDDDYHSICAYDRQVRSRIDLAQI